MTIDLFKSKLALDDFFNMSLDDIALLVLKELTAYENDIKANGHGIKSNFSFESLVYTNPDLDLPKNLEFKKKKDDRLWAIWRRLKRNGYIAPKSPPNDKSFYVTDEGKEASTKTHLSADVLNYSWEIVHPAIRDKAKSKFFRKEYAEAIFDSFKQVEISVREASNEEIYGVPLMRKAFGPTNGKLNIANSQEKEGYSNLFAGAMGLYKNPGSHTNVSIDDGSDAFHQIMLASHLLKIVDKDKKAMGS